MIEAGPLAFSWLWLVDGAATFAGLVWLCSLAREKRSIVAHDWKERLERDLSVSVRARYRIAQAWALAVFGLILWHGAGHLYLIGRHCGLFR